MVDTIKLNDLYMIIADDYEHTDETLVVGLDVASREFGKKSKVWWDCVKLYTTKIEDGKIVRGDLITYYDRYEVEDEITEYCERDKYEDYYNEREEEERELDTIVEQEFVEQLTSRSDNRRARELRFEKKRTARAKKLAKKSKNARIWAGDEIDKVDTASRYYKWDVFERENGYHLCVRKQTERKDAIRVRKALMKSAEKIKEADKRAAEDVYDPYGLHEEERAWEEFEFLYHICYQG